LPDGQPHFSPDGKQLVFQREIEGGTRLMLVGIDGTGLRPLLPDVDASAPAWSPRGDTIAFTLAGHATETTTFNIATVRPDGTHLRTLTDTPAPSGSFEPAYSPNGNHLVFSQSTPDGCPLFTANASGHNPQPLTADPGCFVDASWGPDVRRSGTGHD